jgi:hypothetical protein
MAMLDGIDMSSWGKGENKSSKELMLELRDGDCEIIMRNGTPVRQVRVVTVQVISPNRRQHLVETLQKFHDGRMRARMLEGVSEKLKTHEEPLDGAVRAIEEELGIRIFSVDLDRAEEYEEFKFRPHSTSYPGLPAEYTLYNYVWFMPDQHYKPGYIEDDGVKETYFCWQPLEDIPEVVHSNRIGDCDFCGHGEGSCGAPYGRDGGPVCYCTRKIGHRGEHVACGPCHKWIAWTENTPAGRVR